MLSLIRLPVSRSSTRSAFCRAALVTMFAAVLSALRAPLVRSLIGVMASFLRTSSNPVRVKLTPSAIVDPLAAGQRQILQAALRVCQYTVDVVDLATMHNAHGRVYARPAADHDSRGHR